MQMSGLQQFQSILQGIDVFMNVNSCGFHRPVSHGLADENQIFGFAIQPSSKSVAQGMNRQSGPVYPRPRQPLLEPRLDLASRYPRQTVGEKQRRRMGGHVGSYSQILAQQPAQIGIDEACFPAPALGFDADVLGFEIQIGDVEADQLGKPKTCGEHDTGHNAITHGSRSLSRSQFPNQTLAFRLGQSGGRVAHRTTNLDGSRGIVLHQAGLDDIATEGFDSRLRAIDGDRSARLSVFSQSDWLRDQKSVNPIGCKVRQVHVAGDTTHPRLDLVVCIHEYLPTYPNVAAHFQVVEGTPAASPEYPDLPEHAVLLAKCRMDADGSVWSEVLNAGPPVGTAPELAGPDRTTETVKANADAIDDLSGSGRTTETVKENADAIDNLAGAGRTTETVKDNADTLTQEISERQSGQTNLQGQITDHLDDTSEPHLASSIPIQDSGNRYSGGNVETALQEIAGSSRTTQTVKGNADAISNHVNDGSAAHASSAISTEAVSGSPFSLSAGETQAALASLVGGMNQRALKSGDTFSGAMTFQNDVTFDADDVDDVKFDEDIWFFRTVSAFTGRGIESGGFTTAYLNDTFGGLQFSQAGHNILIPIHGIASCKISKVRFYFQVPPDTSGRATLLLRVANTPSYYAGENSSPISSPIEFELQTSDPANSDATHWATYMHEIDCSDIFISGSDFTKMMFATVIMTEAASHALVFPGVKVAYKRTQMAV